MRVCKPGTAIGTADTSVDKGAVEVCVSPVVDVCRLGVVLLSDLNPSTEEVQLQHISAETLIISPWGNVVTRDVTDSESASKSDGIWHFF